MSRLDDQGDRPERDEDAPTACYYCPRLGDFTYETPEGRTLAVCEQCQEDCMRADVLQAREDAREAAYDSPWEDGEP